MQKVSSRGLIPVETCLQDIGGKVSFETGEAMEAMVSELHADGELTGEALAKVAERFGLRPTDDGGFEAIEGR